MPSRKSVKKNSKRTDRPVLLVADKDGNIYDDPRYGAGGMAGGDFLPLKASDLIPLPEGSRFYYISKGLPVGFAKDGSATVIDDVYPVAAFLPPGYTRTHFPAYEEVEPKPILPLWSYTAAAWYKGEFHAAAVRVAWMKKADPKLHDDAVIGPLVEEKLKQFPKNRLLKHLSKCAMFYHCFAAKNIFVGRWEAPLPSSPVCNARCIGCLSLQEGECCASQDRITFVPTPEEIAEAAVPHLQRAEDPIVSFGQGCEGEPLMQAKTLAQAVKLMRAATSRGVINLNTNGFSPDRIRTLRDAGLDSIRISINSCDREQYNQYYRPRGYSFDDVMDSIATAKKVGLFTSINYIVFPGYTDREAEVEKLKKLVSRTKIDLIQMRNFSIDPMLYMGSVTRPEGKAIGVRKLIRELKKEFPKLKIGYFNLPKKDMKR
ncbi:MAG: radical SAM protein [Nitrospiraceae bacterium]|nr:radical SAM protein [Nitrospiraceae bacterium]